MRSFAMGNSMSNGNGGSYANGPKSPYRDTGWDYRPVTIYDWQFRDYR